MYGRGSAVAPVAVATGAAVTLPNTGGNLVVNLAISAAAGLVTWGVLYAAATK
jgi:hypothetical protein